MPFTSAQVPGAGMRVIGHRGAPSRAPENTLPSFEAAIASGAHAIELDARLTADGVAVVMHDDDVARTTDGTGRVSEMTAEEVGALDAAARWSWPERVAVPTVEEVVALARGRVGIVVELKAGWDERGYAPGTPVARAVVPLLDGVPDVVVSSFDASAVAEVRASGSVRTGLTVGRAWSLVDAIAAARDAGHAEIHPACELLTPEDVAAAHAAGLDVSCWTVNSAERARVLSAWEVDGVFSDDPAVIVAAVR